MRAIISFPMDDGRAGRHIGRKLEIAAALARHSLEKNFTSIYLSCKTRNSKNAAGQERIHYNDQRWQICNIRWK